MIRLHETRDRMMRYLGFVYPKVEKKVRRQQINVGTGPQHLAVGISLR